MGKTTGIGWCDATWNPWWGCTKISTGCAHCYAADLAARFRRATWGPGQERVTMGPKVWDMPRILNEEAARSKSTKTVFLGSMMDFFDPEAPEGLRDKCWDVIHQTPHLVYLILTKRPDKALEILGPSFRFPPNVMYGVSVENQDYARERIAYQLRLWAPGYFVSAEPLLSGLDLVPYMAPTNTRRVSWVIVGGESGPKARPFMIDWLDTIILACRHYGAHCFIKQLGSQPVIGEERVPLHIRHPKGEEPAEWPPEYRIQQSPSWENYIQRS